MFDEFLIGALVGRMIENMKLALSPPNPKEPVRKAYLYSAVSNVPFMS